MKKILVFILSVMTFTNVFAEAIDVKPETFKNDKEILMDVLERGQCGTICVRYERNINGASSFIYAFGFCRVSITVCKD